MGHVHPLTEYRHEQSPPLSQAELAKLLGVSRSYVNRVEAGERQIGQDLVPSVSEKTGIPRAKLRPDLAEIFTQDDAPEPERAS